MIPDLDDRRPALPPPRFGLGAMMAAVTALGVMFALIHYVGMLGSTIALLFILCVIAHVAGNVIGTRLRDVGSQGAKDAKPRERRRKLRTHDFAPVTRLR